MSNQELIRKAFSLIEGGELSRYSEVWAADCELVMPGAPTLRGPEAIAQVFGGWMAAFPDLRHELVSFADAGDAVATELRIRGTHTQTLRGPKGDVPATGRQIDFVAANYIRVDGDRAREWHIYFDQLAFLQQLGLA